MGTASLKQIANDVRVIRDSVERVPDHFNMRHVVAATFGAFFFGLTFALKGLLLQATSNLTENHLLYIILAIFVILTTEIYYIGYSKVRDKESRHFSQFWAKRIATYVVIGFAVSAFLVYLYSIDKLAQSPEHVRNIIIALALPCCTGASVADLLKKY